MSDRVELTDHEREVLLKPCVCGHTLNNHGSFSPCWSCEEDNESECVTPFEALLVERIETIVATRVGEECDCDGSAEEGHDYLCPALTTRVAPEATP